MVDLLAQPGPCWIQNFHCLSEKGGLEQLLLTTPEKAGHVLPPSHAHAATLWKDSWTIVVIDT